MRRDLIVVKLGGSLLRDIATFRLALSNLAILGATRPVAVIPGGGTFADQVRTLQPELGLGESASHWMALRAMDQVAEIIADLMPEARLVTDQAGIFGGLRDGVIPVLAPSVWMRAADMLPHSWDVTSDSVAAFVAGALDARELVLVKRTGGAVTDLVDKAFADVVPATLQVSIVTAEGLAGLAAG